jgi:hypothetical protein
MCYMYPKADFTSNEKFDTGVRIEQTSPSADTQVAPPTSPAAPQTSSIGLFTIRANTEATGPPELALSNVVSTAACEEVCKREPSCDIFSYDKRNGICRRYTRSVLLDFKSNEQFDSGVRQTNPSLDIKVAAPTSPAATQVSSTGLFTIRTNTEAMGLSTGKSNATSRAACEEICTREASCRIFTYRKGNGGGCYRYAGADFRSNASYDSGVRIEQPK